MEKTKIKALVDDVDYFIGIDHHKKTSYITIKDREGEIVKKGGVVTSGASVADFIHAPLFAGDDVKVPRTMAVIESGRAYRPMYKKLSETVDEVLLAHPGALKIISETVYKDDKLDSGKLADLLMLGTIPQAHAASEEAWARRMILRHRVMLVRMASEVKTRIHVIADLHPEALPRRPDVTDLFGIVGLDWLQRLDIPASERWRLDEMLDVLAYLKSKIARSDSLIREIVREDRRCRLLKTMPGIGDFFAALIVAEVDDINRFPSARHFASYTGLVPRRDSSGSTDRSGRLQKQGNAYLRWAFVEAAIPAMKSNLALKQAYDRIRSKRGGQGGPQHRQVRRCEKACGDRVPRAQRDETL